MVSSVPGLVENLSVGGGVRAMNKLITTPIMATTATETSIAVRKLRR